MNRSIFISLLLVMLIGVLLRAQENTCDGCKKLKVELEIQSEKIKRLTESVENLRKYIIVIIPVGTIVPYYGNEVPQGWLKCEGQEITGSFKYRNLVALLTRLGHGTGITANGVKKARVPNLCNMFLRGQDKERRRKIGARQDNQNRRHKHPVEVGNTAPGYHGLIQVTGRDNDKAIQNYSVAGDDVRGTHPVQAEIRGVPHKHDVVIGEEGGDECRPDCITIMYIIKY